MILLDNPSGRYTFRPVDTQLKPLPSGMRIDEHSHARAFPSRFEIKNYDCLTGNLARAGLESRQGSVPADRDRRSLVPAELAGSLPQDTRRALAGRSRLQYHVRFLSSQRQRTSLESAPEPGRS